MPTLLVEVAHADLAGVPRMVVIVEHAVVVHASGVLPILPYAGRRCCRRRRRCPLNSIPPFPPRVGVSTMETNKVRGESREVYHMH